MFVPPGEYTIHFFTATLDVNWTGLKAGSKDLVWEQKPFVYSEKSAGEAFDELWEAMDRSYSYFFLKKDVDWKALKVQYRPKAVKAKSEKEFVNVLKEMLAHLKDLHIWIDTPDGSVGAYISLYQPNWNRKAILVQLDEKVECGRFAVVGNTKENGFGYFLLVNQDAADEKTVQQVIGAIEKLKATPGFIVDLRRASGGDERKAQQIARLFCGKKTVYAKSKYRNDPDHGDFTKVFDRWLEPAEKPYLKPVICLIGPGAVSSGEGFVQMMKCLPHVTTVGLPTRGASGNPNPVELSGTGLAVWFSRWVDMLPDGSTFEGRGIAPDVEVNQPVESYAQGDPTLEKGLQLLHDKVAR
jgi:C-terminal processing protease CtpA/Prc